MKKTLSLILSIIHVAFLNAQVYDYVVAKDGTGNFSTIQEAINAAPTGTTRITIFIKKGVYNEKLYLGSHSVSINKIISLIGESRDSVVLIWNDYNGKSIYYYNATSPSTSGTPQSASMTVNAADFYMENLTVQNSYTSAQAVALYTLGDRQTFKNCRIVGFQDTQDLKKGRRPFFYQCQIEGGTDFICAGGTAWVDVSGRVNWSMQLAVADVNNFLKLTTVYASLGISPGYDPIPLVVGPTPVSAVTKNGQSLQWTEISGAKGYVIYANGSALGFSKTGSFADTVTRSALPIYTVCSVGAHGNLSLPNGRVDPVSVTTLNDKVNGVVTALRTPVSVKPKPLVQNGRISFELPTDFSLYSLTGQTLLNSKQEWWCDLNRFPKGIYLLNANDARNGSYQTKIQR